MVDSLSGQGGGWVGNDDRWMSGWEEGEEGESGFEPELGGWCSFVGHGVDIVRLVGDVDLAAVM